MNSQDALRDLFGELDYPMFLVTCHDGKEQSGCLVGFVTQASIEPLRVLVLLSKENHTYRVARNASELVVHFLQAGNLELAALFGEETGDQIYKFSRCDWHPTPLGTPLVAGTRGWVAGPILDRVDTGDHVAHLLDPRTADVEGPGPQLGFQAVKGLDPGHPA